MSEVAEDVPALYCARTRLIGESGESLGHSPLFARPPLFRNALVQSVAGGNTMMFNQRARELLVEAGPDIDVQTHDWWAYLVVSGCGGRVRYDPRPTVGYRQHDANLVGSNATMSGRASRARRLLAGRFRDMNSRNIFALERLRARLTPEHVAVFDEFIQARDAALWSRVSRMLRAGVYCQTAFGNLGLALATLLGKV
jgi:hypothetical protein